MPVPYRINQRKDNISATPKTAFMMQAIHTGEVNLERLAQEISHECTLSPTDVIAVLHALGDKVKFHLEEGKVFHLDNLGRFKIGFKAQAKSTPEALSPKNIQKFYVNYQPSLKLKKWLKKGLEVVREKR
ncbi:HU family DNA-binding protein [Mesonia sp. K7]|uniref:HU family DNA-binding protein n=1 Tax=Mesonia sp. K7 TaxID=2218606 RepID=UPI000DA93146|nr:HU family DNA-binding protein [Mesonia sp. K7]PZD76754.1 DNA-binding protein [Mesonia sp. K7]